MAALNIADQQARSLKQLEAALTAYREMLDTFVEDQIPQAAAEAGQVPAGRVPNARPKSMKPR